MAGPPPVPLIPLPGWFGSLTPAPAAPPTPKGPALGIGGPDMPGTKANPLTMAQAEALFAELAGQKHIPFNWPADGCYARAHEMRRLMDLKGVESAKTFNYGNLSVVDPKIPDGGVSWGYHVAPTIEVQGKDGKPVTMVIDPSLSDKLMTNEEWKAKQGDPGSRLEPAPAHVIYKPEGMAGTDPGVSRDDKYEYTKEKLEYFTEKRAAWDAAHPKK